MFSMKMGNDNNFTIYILMLANFVEVNLLISHNPRDSQHKAILACLKQIIDKSLRCILFENSSLEKITSNFNGI